MPFAIAAAVGAVVAAAAPVGALIAGASIGLTGALTIVSAVGAVTAVIGKVTGNEDLMKIGGIVGAVGGIGALASSAGLFGANAAAGGWFSESSAAALIPDEIAVTPQIFGSTPAGLMGTGAVAPVTPVASSPLAAPTPPPAPGAAPPAAAGQAAAGKGATAAGSAAQPVNAVKEWDDILAGLYGKAAASQGGAGATAAPKGSVGAATADTATKGVTGSVGAGDFWDFIKTPGGGFMAGAGIQALGSFVGGAFDPAIAAQAELNRLQLSNMKAPIPAAQTPGVRVTGRPAGGIINSPVPAAGQVTGTVQ